MARLFVFLHVLSAIVWVGGSIVLTLLSGRVAKSNDPARGAAFSADAEYVGKRVFAPASGLLLVTGIGAVLTTRGAGAFSEAWLVLGVVGWIAVAGIGGGLLGPLSGRLKRLLAEGGGANAEALKIRQRIERLARLELVLFLLLVLDMTVKPGLGR
ncbi:MAG: DUF2269 family protein [Actinomycetota bacterium]